MSGILGTICAGNRGGQERQRKGGMEIGEKRGMEIGERRGERRSFISLIIKKIQRGMDILFIADALEESEEVIRPIYEAVLASPDADVDQIYESLYAK